MLLRTLLALLLLLVTLAPRTFASPSHGQVAGVRLPLFVVKTSEGYTYARRMGGAIPVVGEPVLGELQWMAMMDWRLPRQGRTVQVVTEGIGHTREEADAWLRP